MDIKSKNNKRFSFCAAGVLIALAVAVLLAFYPVLGKQASEYYTDHLKGGQLLTAMYRSNLVLYKNVVDKREQRDVPYSELYLDMETTRCQMQEIQDEYMNYEEDRTIVTMQSFLKEQMNVYLKRWKEETMNTVAKYMDYCVLDHRTGEILKNTERGIEKLCDDKSLSDEEGYEYYVMLSFDGAGNLSNISVKDERSDDLLKNVQSVMSEELLKNGFAYYDGYGWEPLREEYYFAYESKDPEKLTCRVDEKTKDVTFIYALTGEQKKNIMQMWSNSSFLESYQWARVNAYFQAGAGEICLIMLLVLAALALVLTRHKRYCLYRLLPFRLHLEVSICAGICLIALTSSVVGLIYWTNQGLFPEFYAKYLEALPSSFYPTLTIAINVVLLGLYFGVWFYLVTSLGEVFDLGLKEFIKERSLIVRFLCRIRRWCRRKIESFKEEVLHVDLGGRTEKTLVKMVMINFLILAVACLMWMFGWAALIIYSFVLYFALKKYIRKIQEQYRKLFAATRSIAEGNLQTSLEEDWGIFESYKEELSKIQNGFRAAVDKEVKSQRMKTELITNVSHDLKTPLTAITTYIELLEEEGLSPEVRREYLGVLKKKAQRLKFLIEDLFEVSKASSGNVTLNPVDVDLFNLMRQVYLEYEDRVEEADLIFRFRLPEEKVILKLDSQKTYRVFENLYVNIIKYAMPHTRVYVNAEKTEKGVVIELKNMSATELNIAPEDLTERFVRGDSSRNTEGSGLGLAIARSFVELQGGQMTVDIDGDLFKVTIFFRLLS